MKTTFKSSEIAHIWFHSRAPYGKAPSAMSFDGDIFLSYNTAIARKVINKRGEVAVIINHNRFSTTTIKHHAVVRHAIPQDVPRFEYAEGKGARLGVSPESLFNFQMEQATRAQVESDKTRPSMKKDRLAVESQNWLAKAQAVSDFFGLRKKVNADTTKKFAAKKAKLEKMAEKQRKEREAAQFAEYSEAFEGWKRGGNEFFPVRSFPVAFRVEENKLVSSLGVRLDLAEAKRILSYLMRRCRGMNQEVHIAIDGYTIQSINPQGIVAGCHRVTWGELERVVAMIG